MQRILRPRKAARLATTQKRDRDAEIQRPVNITGFAAFPAELILEIVSCFPSLPVPFDGLVMDKEYYHAHATLRLLSQLCRSLRRVLLPFVWRQIEACAVSRDFYQRKRIGGTKYLPWERQVGTELVEQLEVVTIRCPQYAAHVRTISVILGNFSSSTILAEFARCLALLPNVEILQYTGPDPQKMFEGYNYPWVRTLATENRLVAMTKSFPGVRHIHVVASRSWPPYYSRNIYTLRYPIPLENVERLTGYVPYGYLMCLWQDMPNLKHLRVTDTMGNTNLSVQHLLSLDMLTKLVLFEIEVLDRHFSQKSRPVGAQSPAELQEMLSLARKHMIRTPAAQETQKRARLLPQHARNVAFSARY